VAFVSGFTTMLACNLFETIPATLIVFKMIDTVPQWRSDFILAANPASTLLLRDARRAALSAVIFGSNFGANTACIGSLGGLMMRRLAQQQVIIIIIIAIIITIIIIVITILITSIITITINIIALANITIAITVTTITGRHGDEWHVAQAGPACHDPRHGGRLCSAYLPGYYLS
jgi:hypothetical protein